MIRPRRLLSSLAIGIAVLTPIHAFAWIDTGHMIVAAIASHELKPRVRAEIDELLKIGGDARTSDFYGAACWADDFKTKADGKWHYIDNYFRSDGKPAENKPDEENVIWAIHKFSDVLADKKASDADRAQALRYVIHFVGDVHQPLHSVSRETDDMPKGDAGGNRFAIQAVPGIGMWHPNLHALWDFACGYYQSVPRPLKGPDRDQIDGYADKIMEDFPEAKLPSSGDLKPEDWMDESVTVAKSVVYQGIQPGDAPSEKYLEQGKVVCEQRLALAGYRLANLLNKLLS
jgi:hypothetical protein